jgi:PAS domain S-box-containing protein
MNRRGMGWVSAGIGSGLLLLLALGIWTGQWLAASSAGLALIFVVLANLVLRQELRAREDVELALQQSNDRLQLRVHERTTELSTVNVALRQSEERARKLVELCPEAIFIHRAGSIVYVNQVGLALFGGRPVDLLGRSPFELIPPEQRAAARERIHSLLLNGKPAPLLEGRIVRVDGKMVDVESVAVPFLDQGEPAILVVLRDVTERNRALAELRQTQERLREQAALLDQVHDAILVVDPEDSILSWNQGAQRVYGWTQAEALGKKAGELLGTGQPADIGAIRQEILERGEWIGELAQRTRDGRLIVVASHWTLLGEDRWYASCVLINIDITEKKKLEAHSLRAQRLESIGTLAGGIAHDLNNALTPVLMALKLLQRNRPEADRQTLLATALASVERGAEMVRHLLGFARGSEGERERVELPAVLAEVRALLEHTLPKSIALQFRVAPKLWAVTGDSTQLSQVLMNLAVNARDAMPQGGQLLIEASDVFLDETFTRTQPQARPGPHVCLRVTDTGTGIPPELLDRIFDPFFTTKEQGKGTGLGLSTVLGIVRGHGGFVNVYSEVGRGTQIAAYLPAQEVPASATPAPARLDLPPAQGELILLVDDEPLILLAARAMLEVSGYRTLTAGSGAEAVRHLEQHGEQVRAVLLDMMMPQMDGRATLRALRALQPQVRVVATSGLATPDRVAEVLADGANAFLQKPYTEEQLLHSLASVLAPGA